MLRGSGLKSRKLKWLKGCFATAKTRLFLKVVAKK